MARKAKPKGAKKAPARKKVNASALPTLKALAAKKPKPVAGHRTFFETTVEVEGRTEKRIVEMPAFEPAKWTEASDLSMTRRFEGAGARA